MTKQNTDVDFTMTKDMPIQHKDMTAHPFHHPRTPLSPPISETITPWVVKAIEDYGQGEKINWEIGVTVLPDPSVYDSLDDDVAEEQTDKMGLRPALILFLEIPTEDPLISVYGAPLLALFGLTEEYISEAVKTTLETLRTSRSRQKKKSEMVTLT